MNRITAKLADVATISFAGSRMTPGFGSIEQHAAEIEREDFRSIDFSTSVEFGKFFPERWTVEDSDVLCLFATIDFTGIRSPRFGYPFGGSPG